MRYIWIIFAGLLVVMLAILPRLSHRTPAPAVGGVPTHQVSYSPTGLAPAGPADMARADSIVAFGLAQRGTPYVWAGTSPLPGFDCSGFIMYTFAHFGVPVPHSTILLIDVGRPVARADAQPGDIVVFTGTEKTSTTPGHAGIVISRRGELPLRFVHASSSRREPFVKVSQVEESDYARRFMQVRRVLGPGTGAMANARARVPVAASATTMRPAPVLSSLPARVVAVEEKAAPAAPLPKVLPKRPLPRRALAHKPAPRAIALRKAMAKRAVKPTGKAPAKPRPAATKTAPAKKKAVVR